MDLADQLLDTWRINNRINLFLLGELTDEQLSSSAPKAKTVVGQLAHIHNVRLMWLKAAAPELHAPLSKLEAPVAKDELAKSLADSAVAIEKLLESALEPGGKVKGFKPHAAAFVGYLIAHESFHRAQAELVLRQAGHPISDKTAYGMWEWGVR